MKRPENRRRAGLGGEEFERVLRLTVDLYFKVQMRAGRAPGVAEQGDLLMRAHMLAARHQYPVEMAVARHHAVAVIDVDAAAIGVLDAGEDDRAGCGAVNRRAEQRHQIEPGMKSHGAVEGIAARAEAAFEPVGSERRRKREPPRHRRQSARPGAGGMRGCVRGGDGQIRPAFGRGNQCWNIQADQHRPHVETGCQHRHQVDIRPGYDERRGRGFADGLGGGSGSGCGKG